jgi:hemoglobin/transferrin/lactoferrin receptor protein
MWVKLFFCAGFAVLFLRSIPVWAQQDAGIDSLEGRFVLQGSQILPVVEQQALQVFTALRVNKQLSDLPFTIHVVTREEIQQYGYITLVDVLKTAPGVKVSQPGSSEEGEMFLLRGLIGNYYMKVLVNGIPIQPSVNGNMPLGAQLPVRQAERIEIIYGPASAVYGADATSGVINIITQGPDRANYAYADLEVGQFGHQYLNFTLGGKLGKNNHVVNYMLYGSGLARNDWNVYQDKNQVYNPWSYYLLNPDQWSLKHEGVPIAPLEITPELVERLDILDKLGLPPFYQGEVNRPLVNQMPHQSRSMGVQFQYKGLTLYYDYLYRRDFASLGRASMVYSYADPGAFYGENIQRVALNYQQKLGDKFNAITNAYYLRHRLNNGTNFAVNYQNGGNGAAYLYAASDDLFAEQLLTFNPISQLEIVAGATAQYSSNLPRTNELTTPFNPSDYRPFTDRKPPPHPFLGHFGYNPIRFSNVAAFLQLYYSHQNFNVLLGVRNDYNSLYQNTFNPRFAGMYKFEKLQVRGSVATAFKAPAASQSYQSLAIYIPDDLGQGIGGVLYPITPNPGLEPEKHFSAETGLHYDLARKISLDASLFYSRIQNLIKGVVTELNDDGTLSANAVLVDRETRTIINSRESKAQLVGLQVTLRGHDLVPSVKLNADLSVTHSKGREILPGSDGAINDYRMVPEWIAQLRVNFSPLRNLVFHTEHILMSGWIRRYTPNLQALENPNYRNDGYYTLDLVTSYQVDRQFRVYARVKNVLDAQYGGIGATGLDVDLLHNPQPGRNMQVGLSYRFE